MKAKHIQNGDCIWLPDLDFKPSKVRNFYYTTPDNITIELENGFGVYAPPDQDILIARKGQVL